MPAKKRIDVAYEPPQEEGLATCPSSKTDEKLQSAKVDLSEVAVLPEEGDNCAIVRRRLDPGRVVIFPGGLDITMSNTVLEGHRIAVLPLEIGDRLLSWGLPFGKATRKISVGDYVVNDSVLSVLHSRHIGDVPASSNFEDLILPHEIDESRFQASEQVPLMPQDERGTFQGYDRYQHQGGVGTRNYIGVIPTSAYASPLARQVVKQLKQQVSKLQNCHGIVALAHTEAALADGEKKPRNFDLLLRTLAGFVSHPNLGGVLVVGYTDELLTPTVLRQYCEEHGIKLPRCCEFLELDSGNTKEDIDKCKDVITPWFTQVDACQRSNQPLTKLLLALQCGGSDAFSGVSGNPASGWAAKYLIEQGGAAVLAETDELIGAESYILKHTKDLEVAQKFVRFVERFKERFSWHGQSAESNPSGGNKLRGLYNIALKSLGAAKKKHADVSLDGVLDYSERVPEGERGYYFMDSPGNDLESIAGQVATGCNMIFFITGNGSITNFPFVPTIKIVTTTDRFRLLESDMDFNAGRFQDDGIPMDQLGKQLFDQMVAVASGELSVGERAGHSQVSIWREWARDWLPDNLAEFSVAELKKDPIDIKKGTHDDFEDQALAIVKASKVVRRGRLGLVLPTSLCSAEIARQSAEELECEREKVGPLAAKFDRFLALPHTEGCGIGYAGGGEDLFARIMVGHLTHDAVESAVLLEHGCEKTHNTWMKEQLEARGIDVSKYGFASVQLDGGIASSTERVHKWFEDQCSEKVQMNNDENPLTSFALGLLIEDDDPVVHAFALDLVRAYSGASGTVIIPSTSSLLRAPALLDELQGTLAPTIAFAERPSRPGVHIMHIPDGVLNKAELVTGLAASGVSLVLNISSDESICHRLPLAGHPIAAVLKVTTSAFIPKDGQPKKNVDLALAAQAGESESERRLRWLAELVTLLKWGADGSRGTSKDEVVAFQVARGPTGVSA